MITSRTNPQIKEIKKLLTSSKRRNEEGLFVVEGAKMAEEVPESLLKGLYVSESFMKRKKDIAGSRLKELLNGENAETVSDEVYNALTDTVTPQGILAVVKRPEYRLDRLVKAENPAAGGRPVPESGQESPGMCSREKYVLLDDIRDPGNLGTIIRTSEAAGVKAVILSPGCVDIFNPKVIRSTMGSIFRVPFAVMDLCGAVFELKNAGVEIFGAALKDSSDYRKTPYPEKCAFIIGNEANGISEKVLKLTDRNLKIPMHGEVESLNAAISCAVLLFNGG